MKEVAQDDARGVVTQLNGSRNGLRIMDVSRTRAEDFRGGSSYQCEIEVIFGSLISRGGATGVTS